MPLDPFVIETLDHARPEVAADIHRVMLAAYHVEAALLGVADFVPLRRTAEKIVVAEGTFLGVRDGELLLGVVEIEPPVGDLIIIGSLVVLPDHFRRGVGRSMVRHVLATHADRAVRVSTGRANDPALRLYASLGFVEHRRWQTYDDIPMVTLVCPTNAGLRPSVGDRSETP